MFFVNTIQPLTIILLIMATILLIFLGKEIKKPVVPAIALMMFLILLISHTVQLTIPDYKEMYVTIRYCIAFELTMVFITFFSYLWVDDISSKLLNKKNLDTSLDWFWKQI